MVTSRGATDQGAQKHRAQRFPIRARVLYGEGGAQAWAEGETVNISRSGVLFRGMRELKPLTILQMRIIFSEEHTGVGPASILGWGRVARVDGPMLAARFHPPEGLVGGQRQSMGFDGGDQRFRGSFRGQSGS